MGHLTPDGHEVLERFLETALAGLVPGLSTPQR
jgi:hypothetical protein